MAATFKDLQPGIKRHLFHLSFYSLSVTTWRWYLSLAFMTERWDIPWTGH